MEKVLLPKIKFVVLNRWDVASLHQSRALKLITEEAASCIPNGSELTQELLLLVKNRFHAELDQASVPMWPRKVARLVPNSEAFVAHAVKRALHMFAGILLWDGLIDRRVLAKLAMEEVFAKRLMSFLRTLKGEPRAQACIAAFLCRAVPAQWPSADLALLVGFVRDCLVDCQDEGHKDVDVMRRFVSGQH